MLQCRACASPSPAVQGSGGPSALIPLYPISTAELEKPQGNVWPDPSTAPICHIHQCALHPPATPSTCLVLGRGALRTAAAAGGDSRTRAPSMGQGDEAVLTPTAAQSSSAPPCQGNESLSAPLCVCPAGTAQPHGRKREPWKHGSSSPALLTFVSLILTAMTCLRWRMISMSSSHSSISLASCMAVFTWPGQQKHTCC